MSDARATTIAITHRVRVHPIVGHHGHQIVGQVVLTAEVSAVAGLPAIGNAKSHSLSGSIHIDYIETR